MFLLVGVFDWLESLGVEPINCYLRLILAFNGEIRRLDLELRRMAGLDEDFRLLMIVPGVGYYTALLIKAETGDVNASRVVGTIAALSASFPQPIVVMASLSMVA